MHEETQPAFILIDVEQRKLGEVQIERQEGDLLFGRFVPGPGFTRVAPLFHNFEEAVNSQSLAAVEEIDTAIATLGLTLRRAEGGKAVGISDVQIWSDGGITCKLRDSGELDLNGAARRSQSQEPRRHERTL
jgi:hypothetical protein